MCLFQVRDFLDKLDELVGKVSYANDPIKIKKPALQQKTDKLLHDLLKRSPVYGNTADPPPLLCNLPFKFIFDFFFSFLWSSFVVESQPSMPQGKGALVLRTNVQFSVKTRSALNYRAVLANVFVFLLVSLTMLFKKKNCPQDKFFLQRWFRVRNRSSYLGASWLNCRTTLDDSHYSENDAASSFVKKTQHIFTVTWPLKPGWTTVYSCAAEIITPL